MNVNKLQDFLKQISTTTKQSTKRLTRLLRLVDKKPIASFGVTIGLLGILIVAGSILRTPDTNGAVETIKKSVMTYSIGHAPKTQVSAKIEKSGVITIYAQTAGIVNTIHVTEGQSVYRGTQLLNVSSTYLGANSASLQRQISQIQYDNVKGTYEAQKELLAKQRETANLSFDNSEELRDITNASLEGTREIITLNDSIIASLESTITGLDESDPDYVQTQQILSQFKSANLNLSNGRRVSEYQSSDLTPAFDLAEITKEATLAQLDIQEKALGVSLESAHLQLKLAQVSESLMFPASPFAGVVERVHVLPGQLVNPGTALVTISGQTEQTKAVALVPQQVALRISTIEPSILTIDGTTIEMTPLHIATEATDGQLYAVTYILPDGNGSTLTNNQYVAIQVPIGMPDTHASAAFIPIDAVYQTQDAAYIFVAVDGVVESKTITLGTVQGSFVEVLDGLSDSDIVITSRNVISGDSVHTGVDASDV